MGKIVLSHPLRINGEDRHELDYDVDGLTVDAFIEAEAVAKSKATNTPVGKIMECDYAFHFCLGCAAVMAADQSISMQDLDRLVGSDVVKVSKVGRFFTSDASEREESDPESESEESTSNEL